MFVTDYRSALLLMKRHNSVICSSIVRMAASDLYDRRSERKDKMWKRRLNIKRLTSSGGPRATNQEHVTFVSSSHKYTAI